LRKIFYIVLFPFLISISCFSQGRVVINEFMPWTSNTCGGPTAEFVELLNFGPGPMNIGCYILTDGDFSITIPANTIIQPGEFYVISGQSVIPGPCANIDSTITADLNWNTCNCTSGAIPTTGDGLFTDGGMASEQVVLLDPSLNVVDAVIRSLPVEPSSSITTSTVGGQCTARTFDLDLMTINYETIGESAGRGNSFARKLDGDCGWVKDPQQSANATNNTPSETSDVDYDFAVTGTMDCSANGSIEVIMNASNYSGLFPVNYTLAYDTDNDNIFELTDSYTTGSDNSPNTIPVSNLIAGNYRITVGSALGCNLQTFPFTILQCGPVLPVNLVSFTAAKSNDRITCSWIIANSETLDHIVIEKSADGRRFYGQETIVLPANSTDIWKSDFSFTEASTDFVLVRLRLITKSGKHTFSPHINIAPSLTATPKTWPNPARNQLFAELSFDKSESINYFIFNIHNQLFSQGQRSVSAGVNLLSIPINTLPAGSYQLLVQSKEGQGKPVRLSFIKL
jgi:hypothetical protein